MKHTPWLFIAFAPFLAAAGEGGALQDKIDVQQLQDDLELSKVLGADVQLQGGRQDESGAEVQDVLIASDGRVEAVLIDGLTPENGGSPGEASGRPVSDEEGSSGEQPVASVGTVTDEGLTKVRWDQVSYDPAGETISVASGSQVAGATASPPAMEDGAGATGMPASSTTMPGGEAASSGESFQASELIGMEVHLSDAKSFGEVGDVLINEQEGKASALIVNAWEGFDRQTYALPVELQAVDREDDAIDYDYTESDVIALQEYEKQ